MAGRCGGGAGLTAVAVVQRAWGGACAAASFCLVTGAISHLTRQAEPPLCTAEPDVMCMIGGKDDLVSPSTDDRDDLAAIQLRGQDVDAPCPIRQQALGCSDAGRHQCVSLLLVVPGMPQGPAFGSCLDTKSPTCLGIGI